MIVNVFVLEMSAVVHAFAHTTSIVAKKAILPLAFQNPLLL